MAGRLPQPEVRPGGIGKHRHEALVLDFHRLDPAGGARGDRRVESGLDVGGMQVDGPPVRAVPLRVVVNHPGHRRPVLGRVDVAAVLRSRVLEAPAEHRAVELLGAVDIRCRQVDPAWGTQRGTLASGHDGLLQVVGQSGISTARHGKTHRATPSTFSALSLKISGTTAGSMSSASKSRRQRSILMYG